MGTEDSLSESAVAGKTECARLWHLEEAFKPEDNMHRGSSLTSTPTPCPWT
jgi:hypothetical protein